jgi:hypothetical protein
MVNESEIIDYSRRRTVNYAFAIFVIIAIAVAVYFLNQNTGFLSLIITFIFGPFAVGLFSIGFGAASKRAIDYIPGEWETEKTWVTIQQYETMREKYEEAYGHLTKNENACCGCVCGMFVLPVLFFAFLIPFDFSVPPFLYSLIFTTIIYLIVGAIGFWVGYATVSIDADEFFKNPGGGSVNKYVRELANVPDVKAGFNVTLGTREGIRTIIEAEPKIYVEGLPETVALQVQVSESGFVYPYIVGTVYKGGRVREGEDRHRIIGTRFPALLEYSMDDDVAVVVGRFDIPKRTSSVPHISENDFRRLAVLVVEKLKEIHESGQ